MLSHNTGHVNTSDSGNGEMIGCCKACNDHVNPSGCCNEDPVNLSGYFNKDHVNPSAKSTCRQPCSLGPQQTHIVPVVLCSLWTQWRPSVCGPAYVATKELCYGTIR